jgi:hypothetical protein
VAVCNTNIIANITPIYLIAVPKETEILKPNSKVKDTKIAHIVYAYTAKPKVPIKNDATLKPGVPNMPKIHIATSNDIINIVIATGLFRFFFLDMIYLTKIDYIIFFCLIQEFLSNT